ncbi:response regulator transcription factor [Christiangramia aquimixticola]|uniref:response regulator transcription factor n=1 Tax=Christiangramia aquimixticola TaxID=1697558 RepID=UPI003AA7E987
MKKIFLVEDDHGLRDLISFLLEDKEYDVEAFPNATSFEKRINNEQPDLILLDIMLPDGNGVELCKNLKNSQDKNEVPIVLMSAHADPSIADDSGANDFIKKPFDIEELYSRLEKY